MQLGGSLIAIAAWVALWFVVGGVVLLSLCFRGEFADDASSDQPHGDIPFIPEDFKIRACHLAGDTES